MANSTETAARPLWSVMIPTYNCAHYLRQTLESVLVQDPGPDQMQIEVVDNCSDKDDPEEVVRAVAPKRVIFHRNPTNVGMYPNFNICIERSRGELVHILHGDDFVAPTFYARLGDLAARHPEAALLASRSFFVDQNGTVTGVTRRLPDHERVTHDCSPFYCANPLQFAGVVVRREFYERHGGFDLRLVYCGDCEMWARAIYLEGGIILPEPLAHYRNHDQNDSARVKREAENFRDLDRLADIFEARHPDFPRWNFRRRMARSAWKNAEHFRRQGMNDAWKANLTYWKATANPFQKAIKAPVRLIRWLKGG